MLLSLCLSISFALSAMDRRKEQFLSEPSYMILPMPYSLPGIGEGIMLTGLAANIFDTNIDLFGVAITGDAEGIIMGVDDFHLISETLFIELMYQDLSKAMVQNYDVRGMDTKKDEFQYIELSKVLSQSAKATLSLFDRMFELYARYFSQEIEITRIRTPEGDLIGEFSDPYKEKNEQYLYGFTLDYTDDHQDPRKGLRLTSESVSSPRQSNENPDYYVMNYQISAFIPLGESSTWAFNLYASDAVVRSEGDTDYDNIKAIVGLTCEPTDAECLETEDQLIQRFIAARKYGTADSLGGDELLRAYPQGRFQAAHMYYYSTELRWNFAQDVVPFNFWIWKDVATGFQLAVFYEAGSVADLREDLGKIVKTSQGVGFRMVSASGYVYRTDLAWGDEGMTTTIMFGYPW